MGLFGSKKKTVVGTTVSRLLEDDKLPNAAVAGCTKALFDEENLGDITDYMLDEILGSLGTRAESMYRYGRDAYIWGLPSGTYHTASKHQETIRGVLEQIEGVPVVLDYAVYGAANFLHIGWQQIVKHYGYDFATNELPTLSTLKGKKVYLDDMVVVVPQATYTEYRPGVLAQMGRSPRAGVTPERKQFSHERTHSPINIDSVITDEFIRVKYVWQGDKPAGPTHQNAPIHKEYLDIPLQAIAGNEEDFFQAWYEVAGQIKLWDYLDGEGTYPILDAIFEAESGHNAGHFFPFTYFRFGKQPCGGDKEGEEYKSTKRLMTRLGMDYEALVEAINDNPDIADVEQAMLMFGVPANSKDPTDARYLFDFFSALYTADRPAHTTPSAGGITTGLTGRVRNEERVITIQDKRFAMSLVNNGIYRKSVPGSIGAVGHYSGEATKVAVHTTTIDSYDGTKVTHTRYIPCHMYRHQVSEGMYEEVQVMDLEMRYHIISGHQTTSDEDAEILLIPLDHAITNRYSVLVREQLYARSMHCVFNSVQIIKIKWYQRGIFKAIIMVIGIVCAYFTAGSSLYWAMAAMAAGFVTIGIILLMQFVLTSILVGLVLQAGLKFVADKIGGKLAIVLAVIVAVVALAYGTGDIGGMFTASDLLNASNILMQEGMADMMADLSQDYTEFGLLKDAKQAELDAANKLLETNTFLTPFIVMGENPTDFFNRTIHSGNTGMIGIDAISSYVDTALRLPKLDDTLGGNYD